MGIVKAIRSLFDILVIVNLPNDQSITVSASRNTLGTQILSQVCNKLHILEREYFGLKYKAEHQLYWLNLRNPIGDICIIPLGSVILHFHVKFFVASHFLTQIPTRRWFYHDVVFLLTEVPTVVIGSDVNISRLIALWAQIELGACKQTTDFDLQAFYARCLIKLSLNGNLEKHLQIVNSRNARRNANLAEFFEISGQIDVPTLLLKEKNRINEIITEHQLLGEMQPDEAISIFLKEAFKMIGLGADFYHCSIAYNQGTHFADSFVGITSDRLFIKTGNKIQIKFSDIKSMNSQWSIFDLVYSSNNKLRRLRFKLPSWIGANAIYRSIAERQAFYNQTVEALDLKDVRLIKLEIFPVRTLAAFFGRPQPEIYKFDIPKPVKDLRDGIMREIHGLRQQLGFPIKVADRNEETLFLDLPHSNPDSDQGTETPSLKKPCSFCVSVEMNIAFVPCGHAVCCEKCSQSLITCPICRQMISHKQKIFF